jgi:hypothetical protein
MPRIRLALLLLSAALMPIGCEGPIALDAEPVKPIPQLAGKYDAANCGQVSGRVLWDGPIPSFSPIAASVQLDGGTRTRRYPNPNAPRIDRATQAVAGAVVCLEGVNPDQSRAWDHPPVRVEIHEAEIRIVQGEEARHVGFVHRGDDIETVSRDRAFHALCARGAAFFSLTFPEPDRPRRRRLDQPGLVDLSSAAAKYWHQAYLFVADHPYFTLTDAAGHFTLPAVPSGHYRVVCWLPDGTAENIDRDPNIGAELRRHYAKPIERRRSLTVTAGQTCEVEFRLER